MARQGEQWMSFQFVNVDYVHPMSRASNGEKKQQSLERREWQLCFAALIWCSMGWMEWGLLTVAQKPICSLCELAHTHRNTRTYTQMPPFLQGYTEAQTGFIMPSWAQTHSPDAHTHSSPSPVLIAGKKKQPDEQADRQGWANWSVLDWMLNKWMPLCRWINRNTLVKRKQSLYSVDNTEFKPKPTPPLAWENHYPFEILRVKILYMLTHTICVCVCAKIEVHCVENARCGESPRAASSQTNVRINRSSRRLARRRLSPYPSFADLMERDT